MTAIINAPLIVTSPSLTQNVKIELDIDTSWLEVSSDNSNVIWKYKKIFHVSYDNGPMCKWRIGSRICGFTRKVYLTAELFDVVNDSEVKVSLNGVVLDVHGSESILRASAGGVIKKGGEPLEMVFASGSDVKRDHSLIGNPWSINGVIIGRPPKARLYLTIEYLDKNIPFKEAVSVIKKFMETTSNDFSQAVKAFLASPSFTNVKIVCSDGTEINANKEFLASRSPVFEAMFHHDMKEAATGLVQVTDICGKSMKVLVEYLTSGQLDASWNSPDVVKNLAIAADKYGIESLREFLDDWLGEEKLVQSNLDLLNMVAVCGYPKAERKIAVNVARRAKGAKTRDEFLASIGMKRKTMNKQRKKLVDNQLKRWMNSQLGDRLTSAESTLELLNLAADEGLDLAETKLVQELGERLELARNRDEVLKVLGTEEK